MKVKRDLFQYGTFILKNRSQISFWEDKWLGNRTLRDQYSPVKNRTLANILGTNPPNISWCRDLIGDNLMAWNILHSRITNIELSQEDDEFHRNPHHDGVFSVKLHYLDLIHNAVLNINKQL
jgi:hypothetical protein